MAKNETEKKVLKDAMQEVGRFIYWEIPMEFWHKWNSICKAIDEALEEEKVEEVNVMSIIENIKKTGD